MNAARRRGDWRDELLRRWKRPPNVASMGLIVLVSSAAWWFKEDLNAWLETSPAGVPAAVVGLFVWLLLGASTLYLEGRLKARLWLQRAQSWSGLAPLGRETVLSKVLRRIPDPLEWVTTPLRRTQLGIRLLADWRDAGFGEKLSRYLLLLAGVVALGAVIGTRIGGPVLALGMALILPLIPIRVVRGRAEDQRKRFGDQIPAALEAISAGLAAGLSFPTAVAFAAEELPPPMKEAMQSLHRRMELGHSVEDSLSWLQERHPEEGLNLAAEGIVLQRQLGGDLVRMLEETSTVVRQRVQLEQEVRAVTAQGRLSGWVIGALVPVSAVILLVSNPRYIDVLFDTLIGQALLVVALLLQLVGWLIISRLVRVRY